MSSQIVRVEGTCGGSDGGVGKKFQNAPRLVHTAFVTPGLVIIVHVL